MTVALTAAVEPLRARAPRTALLFDFDGTLSPLVDDPAAARPAPGVAERLERLAGAYRTVGVLSGRPVAFLAAHLPATLALSGLYGLETLVDGVVVDHPDAARWRPVVAEVAELAAAAAAPGGPIDGAVVEPKGLSLTLHVRTRPHLAPAVHALAAQLAEGSGLELRTAKMSVELHPPIAADKGTALRRLAAGADAVVFVGDDVGDLPAFDALAGLGDGVHRLAVAVGGPELPDIVRSRAQLVLADQSEVIALLDALLP